ncbi:MAG TPA: C4-type zinc ribbon domain-containing protein [Anaerolineales bacterium]|nr:C4-type zinc ribbon domain-containing protein [Anaerolineales bacterium]
MDQIRARLKTIRETLENDLELRAAIDAFSTAENFRKQADSMLKQSEAEVEKQSIKIKQTEANLYSGSVHNPKELQDLQKDAVSLKKHLGTLEERELEAMIHAEETEKVLQSAKEKLAGVQANWKDQNLDLANESNVLNKDLERLESERNAVTKDLDEQAIKTYEQLRRQKRGVAVTLVSEDACSACGTTLTASQQQGSRSTSQLFYCPTCGRIVYSG